MSYLYRFRRGADNLMEVYLGNEWLPLSEVVERYEKFELRVKRLEEYITAQHTAEVLKWENYGRESWTTPDEGTTEEEQAVVNLTQALDSRHPVKPKAPVPDIWGDVK